MKNKQESMAKRRSKGYLGEIITAGIVTVAVAGLCYWWFQDEGSSSSNDKKRVSRCILLSKSLEKKIDWGRAASLDTVIVIPPQSVGIDDHLLESFPQHRIITCKTIEGVWSVIRHLRKDEVLMNLGDIGEFPEDLHRYSRVTEDLSLF